MTEKDYKPTKFISESVEALFDKPPLLEKKPPCPDGFIWRGTTYRIVELLSEWKDYGRRGRMAHTMRPENIKKALRRGSVGVGRFHFRVKIEDGRMFDLVYDRAARNVDDRKGGWTLRQEVGETPK
jgi:hypothetical protein